VGTDVLVDSTLFRGAAGVHFRLHLRVQPGPGRGALKPVPRFFRFSVVLLSITCQ
jgi:hypothetical protein